MEYENMRVMELKALARDRGLRNYSAELVALLQNNPPPAPQMSTWEPIDDRRPRQPTQQEMDIFEQQEMSKSRPQVKSKLNNWYDWLINHVPKLLKMAQVEHFETFKDKIMGLYNRVTGSTANQTQLKGSRSAEPEPFNPIELEQAFNGAYRSYRVNGRSKIDVDTFFNRIRKGLIELIKREQKTQTSARIQRLRGLGSLGMTRRARKELS